MTQRLVPPDPRDLRALGVVKAREGQWDLRDHEEVNMPKKIKRPVGPINPPPNQSGLGNGLGDMKKPPMKGKKVASKRKGTQLVKAFNKPRKPGSPPVGDTTAQSPLKKASRKKAKKSFTGSAKNFQKAYKAYKRTIKKRNRSIDRKGY